MELIQKSLGIKTRRTHVTIQMSISGFQMQHNGINILILINIQWFSDFKFLWGETDFKNKLKKTCKLRKFSTENYWLVITGIAIDSTGVQQRCIVIGVTGYNLRFSRRWLWRLPSSGVLRHVALVRTDVSEELSASIIRVTRIGELATTLAVTSTWSLF
jgi:hypothetical protein